MNTREPFTVFGPSHLAALAATALIAWWMVRTARRRGRLVACERVLAFLLLTNYPLGLIWGAWDGFLWKDGALDWDKVLPMHLCDWASICGGICLLRPSRRLAELTWFWGLSGTLNGLFTPTLLWSFPSPEYLRFFFLHSGVVITAIYLVFGTGLQPAPRAIGRAYAGAIIYAVCAGFTNAITGANYGYLRAKPANGTLLDVLGPWPWYIGSLLLLALLFFLVLDLPFRRGRRRVAAAKNNQSAATFAQPQGGGPSQPRVSDEGAQPQGCGSPQKKP